MYNIILMYGKALVPVVHRSHIRGMVCLLVGMFFVNVPFVSFFFFYVCLFWMYIRKALVLVVSRSHIAVCLLGWDIFYVNLPFFSFFYVPPLLRFMLNFLVLVVAVYCCCCCCWLESRDEWLKVEGPIPHCPVFGLFPFPFLFAKRWQKWTSIYPNLSIFV